MACNGEREVDEVLGKIYRFTSVLSWFQGGYVDVSGYVWGSHPMLYGGRSVYSAMGVAGPKSFNCNHMPLIDNENVRKALAFWREGKRLAEVHDSYAFLSFFKVIECQFPDGKNRGAWVSKNIDNLTGRAAKRVAELREAGIDVSDHLYRSGRCAVAHATFEEKIVDPDIPADRKRLSADLVIMEELARLYIKDQLRVPDSRSLYVTRNRLAPWDSLLPVNALALLKSGDAADLSALNGKVASVGLWPDGPIDGLEHMTIHVESAETGIVKLILLNERKTVLLVFFLDYNNGRAHTNLDDGGLLRGPNEPDEKDVRAYATFFYSVLGNGIAELTCGDLEPIDCEVVIPVNIIPPAPEEAIASAVQEFRKKCVREEKN